VSIFFRGIRPSYGRRVMHTLDPRGGGGDGGLLFTAQFHPDDRQFVDPTDYAFNEEARRLLARIACERNRDAVSRLARQPHPSPRSSNPFLNYAKQYHCYSEQRRLELTDAERVEVFGIVTSVFDYTNDKRRVVLASHVIVKLFCDMYTDQLEWERQRLPDFPHSSCQILTFCLKMLQSDYVCVRKHAFEILLNVAVHLNLLHRQTRDAEDVVAGTAPGEPSNEDKPPQSPTRPQASSPISGPGPSGSRRFSTHSDDSVSTPPPVDARRASEVLTQRWSFVQAEPDVGWYVDRIHGFHRELVWVAHEALHFLVTAEEADDTVWAAALTAWLTLVSNTNDPMDPAVAAEHFPFFPTLDDADAAHPSPSGPYPTDVPLYVLRQVDVRALRRFLDLRAVRLDARLSAYLLHLLAMALFLPIDDPGPPDAAASRRPPRPGGGGVRPPALAAPRLAALGGIDAVLRLYVATHVFPAREALFAVVYFYAVHLLEAEDPALHVVRSRHAADTLWWGYRALRAHHVPWHLAQIFRYLPPTFVEALLPRLLPQDSRAASDGERLRRQKYTKPWILTILYAIRHIATGFQQLEPAFVGEVRTMLVEPEKTHRCFELLTQLLGSAHADERAQGEAWLFALMKSVFEADKTDSTIAAIMSVKQRVEQVLSETLCQSGNPAVRRIFIAVTERFILLAKTKSTECQSPVLIAQIHKMLNRSFLILCLRGETDLDNLLAMYDVLLNYLCQLDGSDSPPAAAPSRADTFTERFLRGAAAVPLRLLVEIELDVLKYLLLTLSQQHRLLIRATERQGYVDNPTIHDVRRTLMLLVLEHAYHCEASYRSLTLDFFQYFLSDPCPAIGLHASSFIVHRLQRAGPGVYRDCFTKAFATAQLHNDIELLENQYFLSCLLMDHLTEFPPLPEDP
jgi:hypothetical protein